MYGVYLVPFDVDPNVVKPGWTALIVTLLLAGAVVLLYFSMRRQFRKINVPYADESAGADTSDGPGTPTSTR